jgi:molybdenum cofactor cytidylyltransferase
MTTILVLAAGRGERFLASGGTCHKLAAVFRGKTVLQHTLDAVIATGLPYHVVTPTDNVMLGMGDSIARGVAATPDAQGWLVLPADLPMISPSTLLAVADELHGSAAVVQAFVDGKAAHPVGFNKQCRERLLALHGDEGARSVVQYFKALGLWQALTIDDAGALQDVDTVSDLLALHPGSYSPPVEGWPAQLDGVVAA